MLDRVKVMINYDEEGNPGKLSQRDGIEADFIPEELGIAMSCLEYDGQEDEEKILADFLSGQEAALEKMEKNILEIKKWGGNSKNKDELRKIFQSLKKESGMLGMSTIETVCHEAESLLENIVKDKHLEGLLAVKDWIKKSFDSWTGQGSAPCEVEVILAKLKNNQSVSVWAEQTPGLMPV
ncbi:Hpt domain-containing protein [Gemmatimonadota bacterium]